MYLCRRLRINATNIPLLTLVVLAGITSALSPTGALAQAARAPVGVAVADEQDIRRVIAITGTSLR